MSGTTVTVLLVGTFILILSWLLYTFVYNLVLSPLSYFPGPKLWAISRIPSQLSVLSGHTHLDIAVLHDRYGPVVRIGPNELAFNTPAAFRDIYGNRPGRKIFSKDPTKYVVPPNGVDHLVSTADNEVHARHRKLLAPAFSERSLKDQEGIVRGYVDALITKLRAQISETAITGAESHSLWSGAIDIKSWLNFTTFDITGDLMFSESFDCLRESRLHPWIELIFNSIKAISLMGVVNQFPWAHAILQALLPQSVIQKGKDHFSMAAQKVDARLAMSTERPDFVSAALRNGLGRKSENKQKMGKDGRFLDYQGEDRMLTREEVHSNAFIIIIAGSETSATLLAGAVFLLGTHQAALSQLVTEIRSTFASDESISFARTTHLPYLNAVIEESLRTYPPFVTSLARVSPEGGEVVDRMFIPEGTIVACHHYASYHSRSNFSRPDDFIPERWLVDDNGKTDPAFRGDRRDVLQPFSLGPQSCLGKPLAYAEIRLILAKLLWNFDIELCSTAEDRKEGGDQKGTDVKDWMRTQQVYFLWDKPPLWVRLRGREQSRKEEGR